MVRELNPKETRVRIQTGSKGLVGGPWPGRWSHQGPKHHKVSSIHPHHSHPCSVGVAGAWGGLEEGDGVIIYLLLPSFVHSLPHSLIPSSGPNPLPP